MLFAIALFAIKCPTTTPETSVQPAIDPVVQKSVAPIVPIADPAPDPAPKTATPDPKPTSSGETRSGEATRYNASGQGSCETPINDQEYAVALNKPDYGGNTAKSAQCGSKICILTPIQLEVVVNNVCPECKPGDLDLNEATWHKVYPTISPGREPVTWKAGSC